MTRPVRGGVDGGVGRGVPMSRKDRDDEDEAAIVDDGGDDLFELESDDAEPDDRRRDPLRRR